MFYPSVFSAANGDDLEWPGLKPFGPCRSRSAEGGRSLAFAGAGLVHGDTAHPDDLDQIIHRAAGEAKRIHLILATGRAETSAGPKSATAESHNRKGCLCSVVPGID